MPPDEGAHARGGGAEVRVHSVHLHPLPPEHTGEFPMGVGHRVENGWGLTKVAVVLLIGLIW